MSNSSLCGAGLLADQLQDEAVGLVSLGEHRGAGLGEGGPLSELRGFFRHIDIDNTTGRGFEVGLVKDQQLGSEVEAVLLSAVVGAETSDFILSFFDDRVYIITRSTHIKIA